MTFRTGILSLFAICSLAFAASVSASHGGPASQNVYGIFPDGRHGIADVQQKLGPKYIRLEIPWAVSDAQGGVIRFDTENDRKIAEIEAAGMRVFPTIIVGRGWMNGLTWPPEGEVPRSVPPGDLSTIRDPRFGYSESYFNFIRDFVQHYQGHFDFIAIEHQVDHPLYWGGTTDEYLRLLKTASMAIKSVDGGIVVTHAGINSMLWGQVIAKDWLTRGVTGRREAIDFAHSYVNSEQPIGSVPPLLQARENVEASLDQPTSDFNQKQLPFVNKILDGLSGSVDAVNLHYHHDARYLIIVAEWLRERAARAPTPYTPLILTNDLGITATPDLGCATGEHFSPQELDRHARMLFKRLIAARGARLEVVVVPAFETVCESSTLEPNHVDLFDPARPGTLRPAGESFRRFVAITGPMMNLRLYSAGPELFAVWFDDAAARQALLAVWSEVPGGQDFTLLVSPAFASALITDYAGNTRRVPVVNGDLRLSVSSTPVLVQLLLPEAPLSIASVTPSEGSTAGGTPIAIAGTSFAPGATVVIGGSLAMNVRVVSPSLIEAETAPHAQGVVDVIVANPDGATARLGSGFTYVGEPSRRKRGARR